MIGFGVKGRLVEVVWCGPEDDHSEKELEDTLKGYHTVLRATFPRRNKNLQRFRVGWWGVVLF
jgi:hypothetical protein